MKRFESKTVVIVQCTAVAVFLIWYHGDWFRCLTEHWWVYKEVVGWQTAIAALVGFWGLRRAALYNAKLNRDRDDRIRDERAMAIAAAIGAEIEAIIGTYRHIAQNLEAAYETEEAQAKSIRNGLAMHALDKDRTIYSQLCAQLGELPPSATRQIASFYQLTLYGQRITKELIEQSHSPDEVESALKHTRIVIRDGSTLSTRLIEYSKTGKDPKESGGG